MLHARGVASKDQSTCRSRAHWIAERDHPQRGVALSLVHVVHPVVGCEVVVDVDRREGRPTELPIAPLTSASLCYTASAGVHDDHRSVPVVGDDCVNNERLLLLRAHHDAPGRGAHKPRTSIASSRGHLGGLHRGFRITTPKKRVPSRSALARRPLDGSRARGRRQLALVP